MWHDWHTEVRQAAAQCLGKTSHGRDVHDDIKYCLTYGNERIRLEAISRIGQLGMCQQSQTSVNNLKKKLAS